MPPTFPITYWIGWVQSLGINGSTASTQWLPSLPKRTMSSGEVTLNILKYPGCKLKAEDLEGDLDREQWRRGVKSSYVENR